MFFPKTGSEFSGSASSFRCGFHAIGGGEYSPKINQDELCRTVYLLSNIPCWVWATPDRRGGLLKDVDEFRPYVYSPSQNSITQSFSQVPAAATTTTFVLQQLQHDTTLTTPSGVRVSLTDPEVLFANANNLPVATSTCQNLRVEVIEALDRRGLIGKGIAYRHLSRRTTARKRWCAAYSGHLRMRSLSNAPQPDPEGTNTGSGPREQYAGFWRRHAKRRGFFRLASDR